MAKNNTLLHYKPKPQIETISNASTLATNQKTTQDTTEDNNALVAINLIPYNTVLLSTALIYIKSNDAIPSTNSSGFASFL